MKEFVEWLKNKDLTVMFKIMDFRESEETYHGLRISMIKRDAGVGMAYVDIDLDMKLIELMSEENFIDELNTFHEGLSQKMKHKFQP